MRGVRLPRFGGAREGEIYYSTKEETINGKSMTQIARDLGLSESALQSWRKQFADAGEQAFPGKGHQTEMEEENRRLRRENDMLKQEREVGKKAVRTHIPQFGTNFFGLS